jgi:uncharacterized membrane protein
MIYLPVSFLLFVLFLLLLPFLWFSLALDVVQIAVAKLGFSPTVAALLLTAVMIGSAINIPLYRVESQVDLMVDDFANLWLRQFWGIPLQKVRRCTVVALNIGGGLIPLMLALYQFTRTQPLKILVVTAIVAIISYYASQIVPGIGIQMNPLLAPLTAALSAMLITGNIPAAAPPIAFAGGVLGTLIGADLLHLKEIQIKSVGVLSIGGAGVFDGIALCGLFARLLT